MSEPTGDDLARWATLAEAATPGPWWVLHETDQIDGSDVQVVSVYRTWTDEIGEGGQYIAPEMEQPADAEFCAEAREAVPRLLAHVAAQAEQIAELTTDRDLANNAIEQLTGGWTPLPYRENERLKAHVAELTADLEAGDACGAVGCRALRDRDTAMAAVEKVEALIGDCAGHSHIAAEVAACPYCRVRAALASTEPTTSHLAEQTLDRVRALHRPTAYLPGRPEDGESCRECGADWPCPTIAALDGAE